MLFEGHFPPSTTFAGEFHRPYPGLQLTTDVDGGGIVQLQSPICIRYAEILCPNDHLIPSLSGHWAASEVVATERCLYIDESGVPECTPKTTDKALKPSF